MPVCLMLLQCILLAIGNKARVEVLHFNTITRRAGKGFKSLEWSHHGSEQADGVQAVFPLLNPETQTHTQECALFRFIISMLEVTFIFRSLE